MRCALTMELTGALPNIAYWHLIPPRPVQRLVRGHTRADTSATRTPAATANDAGRQGARSFATPPKLRRLPIQTRLIGAVAASEIAQISNSRDLHIGIFAEVMRLATALSRSGTDLLAFFGPLRT